MQAFIWIREWRVEEERSEIEKEDDNETSSKLQAPSSKLQR
jgi:hypothetical protein